MGIAIRTGSPLSLNLAEPMWKLIAGSSLTISDITEVDKDYMPGLLCIRNMNPDPKAFAAMDMSFSTPSAAGHEVQLSARWVILNTGPIWAVDTGPTFGSGYSTRFRQWILC